MRVFPLLFLAMLPVVAEDLTTKRGKVFKEVSVTRIHQDGIAIMHATGTARVPFEELPAAFVKSHGIVRPPKPAPPPPEDLTVRDPARLVQPARQGGVEVVLVKREEVERRVRARLALKQYTAAEIDRMMVIEPVRAKVEVTWERANYEETSTKRFELILSTEDGVVLQRLMPEFAAPFETVRGWANGTAFFVAAGVPPRFKLRVLEDGATPWDFLVDAEGLMRSDTKAWDEEERKLERFRRRQEELLDGRDFVLPE